MNNTDRIKKQEAINFAEFIKKQESRVLHKWFEFRHLHETVNTEELYRAFLSEKSRAPQSSGLINYSAHEAPEYNIDKAREHLGQVLSEVVRAKELRPRNFVSQHEAYAVILEEVEELWDEIKKNEKDYDLQAQRMEAIQAAAMLIRLLTELL